MERYGTLPMKVYVVMEIGWEYNDENYYKAESAGGTPKIAYANKAEALTACAKKNADHLNQPRYQELVVEWDDDNPTYIEEFFEVKEVELVNE